jgi:hypothetical protein
MSNGSRSDSSSRSFSSGENGSYPNGNVSTESVTDGVASLPQLDFDMLPKHMGAVARTISESQQVPPAMAIMSVLATASASIAGKWQVSPITHNWEHERSSLNVVLVAESSGGKSRTFSKVTKPLWDWEAKERRRLAPVIAQAQQAVDDAVDDYDKALALEKVPVSPSMRIGDTTSASLTLRSSRHYGCLALFDPEGGPLKNLTGQRFNTPPEFELWKKCWDSEYHREDRVGNTPGGETREVHQPVMTALVMTQPTVLDHIAKYPQIRDEGLLYRFLWCHLPYEHSRLPSHLAPPIDEEVMAEWAEALERMLSTEYRDTVPHLHMKAGWVEHQPILYDSTLSKKAELVRRDYEARLLREEQPGQRLHPVRSWAGKACGMAVRIAQILDRTEKAFLGLTGAKLFASKISKEHMEMAVQIVDVLSYHAAYTFKAEPYKADEQDVLDKIHELGWGVSRRDLLRKCSWLQKQGGVSALITALTKLEAQGLVRVVLQETGSGQVTTVICDPDEYTDEEERYAIQTENKDGVLTPDTLSDVMTPSEESQ